MDSFQSETTKTIFGDVRVDLIAIAVLLTAMLWAAPRLIVYSHMPAKPAAAIESQLVEPE